MATGIGDTLRTAREQRGLSLSDVAEDTAISKRKLQALEEERFSALEGDVYVKSSLRLYGRFLLIDPEPLVEQYRREYGDIVTQAPVQPVGEYRERISPVVAFAIVALVSIIGLALIGSLNSDADDSGQLATATDPADDTAGVPGPAPTATPPPVDEAPPEPTQTPVDPVDTEPQATEEPPGSPPLQEAEAVELALNVTGGTSWVRVTVDEEMVLERTLRDGFSQTFTGDEIQMRIGNGGAADVVVNGEQLNGFASGQVVDLTCAVGQSACTVN